MPQVLKPDVRARIGTSALQCFASVGYRAASIATIAESAGMAAANVYRYYPSKQALFDAVLPADIPALHDRLLDARVKALRSDDSGNAGALPARELLDFWVEHRLAMVIILDRAEATPYETYPQAFVRRLVRHVERALPARPTRSDRAVLELVFDNTRRAIARILEQATTPEDVRSQIETFWSYQLPGLDGLLAHIGDRPVTR